MKRQIIIIGVVLCVVCIGVSIYLFRNRTSAPDTEETAKESSSLDEEFSLDYVKKVIEEKQEFLEILEALDAKHKPDEISGSGFTNIYFWLNEDGTEFVYACYEQGKLYHVIETEEERYSELLFDQ